MKRLFCLLFCLSLLGCHSRGSQKPKDLLSQEQMVQILADIHTAEALIETNIMYMDTAMMSFNSEQEKIFKRHHVTQEQFKKTYTYYLNHLQEMDALYEVVVDTLSMRESKAQARSGRPTDTTTQEPRPKQQLLQAQ